MGVKTGDKGRYRRKRRAKLARRVEMRALRAESTKGGTEKKAAESEASAGA